MPPTSRRPLAIPRRCSTSTRVRRQFTYPAHRADGSVPYRGNAGGHTGNIVGPEHAGRLHHELELRHPERAQQELHARDAVQGQRAGPQQRRPTISTRGRWGIIPNPQRQRHHEPQRSGQRDLSQYLAEQHPGVAALEQLGQHQHAGQQRPPVAPRRHGADREALLAGPQLPGLLHLLEDPGGQLAEQPLSELGPEQGPCPTTTRRTSSPAP